MGGVFGKAKFGGKGRNWFKLKDGSNGPYRILPPMGYLSEDGRWSAYYQIHYGYKNSAGKMRTFQSPLIKNNKTKMVESPDAALEFIEKVTARLGEAKAAKNQEMVAKLQELVGGKKSRYNLDKNHYLNVIDLQGNIGILKIRHRCKLALDAEIKKLRDSGVDPLDPMTGRFFVFHRSGTAMDTVYSASVYKEKLHVTGVGDVERDVVHPITDDIARRCCVLKGTDANGNPVYEYREAANLANLFAKPTSEEVARIVQEGEKAVDEILDSKSNQDTETDESGVEEDEVVTASQPTLVATPTPSAVVLQTPVPVASVTQTSAPVVTTVQAPAPAMTNQSVQFSAPISTLTQPPVQHGSNAGAGVPLTTAQRASEMSDAEFLALLKL